MDQLQRSDRGRKGARARWGDPARRRQRREHDRLLRNFLQALAEGYIQQFKSEPALLASLIEPLSLWADSLKLPPDEEIKNGQC